MRDSQETRELIGGEWELYEEDEELEEEEWGKPRGGHVGEPGSGVKSGKAGDTVVGEVITEADVLAAEVLSDKRLLAVFLMLGERPRTAKELVDAKVWGRVKVKSKKREWVNGRFVERVVEEERWGLTPLPQSTMYRVLGRLARSGLVRAYKGLDARKRFYKLTPLGEKVLARVLEVVRETLKRRMEKPERHGLKGYEGYVALDVQEFQRLVSRELGVDPAVLSRLLGVEKAKSSYSEVVLLPVGDRGAERPGGDEW